MAGQLRWRVEGEFCEEEAMSFLLPNDAWRVMLDVR
jgi:hypothetical protein